MGVHSPEKSIWAKAGTAASKNITRHTGSARAGLTICIEPPRIAFDVKLNNCRQFMCVPSNGQERFSCCRTVTCCNSLTCMSQGDMSVPAVLGKPAPGSGDFHEFDEGTGPADLRDYLERIESIGELKRITAEVDPIEEMSGIVYLAARQIGAPAFLFERVK